MIKYIVLIFIDCEGHLFFRASNLQKLGSWGDDFSMITLNEGCKGKPDPYGNIIFSAGSLKELPLECGTQYVDDNNGKITFWNVVQYTPPDNGSPITRFEQLPGFFSS